MVKFARLVLTILLIYVFQTFTLATTPPKREMRAVWIATVMNIDWPSRSGLSSQQQQAELIRLLDEVKLWNLNTVILQVRPAADAFYPSDLEPWTQWLTGTQGKAPEPFYDPLQFTIDECRKRGLELHLWLNPYRAEMDTARNVLSEDHPAQLNPNWFVTYGKLRYFNPGLPQTRNHVTKVVADLVRRYDFDAIHFDDYFYPYPIAGQEFPDSEAFARYPRNFTSQQKDAWRRDNVDLIIKQLHDTIKSIKPHVEFGISPFGVWRNIADDPMGSDTRAGASNYDHLYADILKWQRLGWIDYVTPQIYWYIGMEVADYRVLSQWWAENAHGCNVYVGHGLYRLTNDSPNEAWRSSHEIKRQLDIIRATPAIQGSMFFSAKHLLSNPLNVKRILLTDHYRFQALPPLNNRIEQISCEPPSKAIMAIGHTKFLLRWEGNSIHKKYIVYKFRLGLPQTVENPANIIHITGETSVELPVDFETDPAQYYYMVTALSPTNQESLPVFFTEISRR